MAGGGHREWVLTLSPDFLLPSYFKAAAKATKFSAVLMVMFPAIPLCEPEVIESSQALVPVEALPLSVCPRVALPLPIEPAVNVFVPTTSVVPQTIIRPFAAVLKPGVKTFVPLRLPDMVV